MSMSNTTTPTVMGWDNIQQYLRILLYNGAGALVGAGYMNESLAEPVVGFVLSAGTLAWTAYWNSQRKAA